MKNVWILLAEDGFRISVWEENSLLYRCGGNTYAIVWMREAFNQKPINHIESYHGTDVNEAWKKKQSYYVYYSGTNRMYLKGLSRFLPQQSY